MRKLTFLVIGAFFLLSLGGCVENSEKYKSLQAQLDTLNATFVNQNTEMENLFADLNEISAGMQAIREAENLIDVQSVKEKENGNATRTQLSTMKKDIVAINEAINTYKQQIVRLEGKNKKQSAEFKKLIEGLNAELDLRSQKITEMSQQLADKEKQLGIKNQQITELNQNVDNLNKESSNQKETISKQDQNLHLANYLIGNKKELKKANVISRQGLFCPPIVSSQAQQANFISIDVREAKSIPLNSKKAKVLSVHPTESYTLEAGDDGKLTLKINDENTFWKQTKYLVVMVNE